MSIKLELPAVNGTIAVLCSAAAVLAVAALLPRTALLLGAGLLGAAASSVALAHFAWRRRQRARRAIQQLERPMGRIVECSEPDRVTLELPGDGLEPWAADAWVVMTATLALAALASGPARGVLIAWVVFLLLALALRLFSSRQDRLRIEIRRGSWRVESCEAGRLIRRSGAGNLLPELFPDALQLWSKSGRVAVLRRELEPEERAWLAERLAADRAPTNSSPGELEKSVDQEQPHDDGQCEQHEHAK